MSHSMLRMYRKRHFENPSLSRQFGVDTGVAYYENQFMIVKQYKQIDAKSKIYVVSRVSAQLRMPRALVIAKQVLRRRTTWKQIQL